MYGHAPVAALRSNSLREGCYADRVATPPPREGCHAVRVATLVYRAELVCNDRCNQCVLLYAVPNP